jgi:hypothetical protein
VCSLSHAVRETSLPRTSWEVGCQESEKFVKGFITGWSFDDAAVSNRATVL